MKTTEDDGGIATNFQRIGSESNSHVGREFENMVNNFLAQQGLILSKHYKVPIGIGANKKMHAFDLGSNNPQIIIECKSHTWTSGNNTPSAKITVWNEAMYLFMLAPSDYRKIFFVLHNLSENRGETLAQYYIRTHEHLIPMDVEIWEYNANLNNGYKLK